jgi:hypothetical protein
MVMIIPGIYCVLNGNGNHAGPEVSPPLKVAATAWETHAEHGFEMAGYFVFVEANGADG